MKTNKTSPTLRVLSFNIHKGFNLWNQHYVLEQVRKNIREIGADLVFLQEVVGEHSEGHKKSLHATTASQFEFLADGVWQHSAYGKNAVTEKGHHGNAILSKYPILEWNNLDLSTNRLEKRGLLHVVLEPASGEKLHVMSLHLNLLESGRKIQLKKTSDYIRKYIPQNEKIILAGDFNDWRESATHFLEKEAKLFDAYQSIHGEAARTFPNFFPVLCLDRIYSRGFKVLKSMRMRGGTWEKLSDHLALVAEFEE